MLTASTVMAGLVNNSLHGINALLLIIWIVAGVIWLVGYFSYHRAPAGRYSYGYYSYRNPYHAAGVVALVCFVLWLLFS